MSDKTVEFKGTRLPKSWVKEVAGMVEDILDDYNNPDIEVTLEIDVTNNIDTGPVETITVTRKKKTMWVSVAGGVLALFMWTGCTHTGSGGTHIYKIDHQLKTVNGVQVYTQEVVRVPCK